MLLVELPISKPVLGSLRFKGITTIFVVVMYCNIFYFNRSLGFIQVFTDLQQNYLINSEQNLILISFELYLLHEATI